MNSAKAIDRASDLTVTHTLAALLERLDNSPVAVGADQYRSVVTHLVHELESVASDDALASLLDAHPAAAQVYENLNYRHAGLCRSSLDFSLAAELQAKDVIERAKRAAAR
jgi:hemoglobin-like flavoprotein